MWTIVRFALDRGGDAYQGAFDLLARAGFERCGELLPGGVEEPVLPAAVVADVVQDPAVVSRAIFDALGAAGLRPVAVTGCRARSPRRRVSLRGAHPAGRMPAGGRDDPRQPG